MTANYFYFALIIAILNSPFTQAQEIINTLQGGEFEFNSSKTPCLSHGQRADLLEAVENNVQELKLQNKLIHPNREGGHPLFSWPVNQASGFNFESVWGISNYVDENPAFPNQITDYNCGIRSYDTSSGYNHQGIDVFTWPFGWKQMDDGQAIITAASPGQIVFKSDGNFDRNCAFNNDNWNAIFIQHSDGSRAWYGHLKNGSITSKGIGDTVDNGEYLGVIGSSGNSTGPHLHFEVFDDSNQLVDTYFGPCNTFNPDTWWASQKPYLNPNLNAVLTHSAPPIFPPCPVTEVPNTSDQFNNGELVYLAIYMRDQAAGTTVNLTVRRPNNSIFDEWTFNLTDNYAASYWYWSGIPDMDGGWTWEASYNGQTVEHDFNVGVLGVDEENLKNTVIYPNPVHEELQISSEHTIVNIEIRDMLGRRVQEVNDEHITKISTQAFLTGMYFIRLTSEDNKSKTIKFIKR